MRVVNVYSESHRIGKYIGRNNDTNCCTVVALSIVTGENYIYCHEYLSKYGRKYRKGMNTLDVIDALEELKGHVVEDLGYSNDNRITINRFIKENPRGRFYCLVRGHAIAIVDGVLHDFEEKPRRQIKLAYRISEKAV